MTSNPEVQQLVSTAFLNVNFYTHYQVVEYAIKGFIPSAQLTEQVGLILKAIETHRPKKIIADLRNLQAYPPKDQEYITEFFYPEMVKMGVRYEAAIHSKTVFGELMQKHVRNQVAGNQLALRQMLCKDHEDAFAWLESVE